MSCLTALSYCREVNFSVSSKTRFAPSPTGYLHLGNVRTALFNFFYGDRFLLRIEDTDPERSRPEYTEALQEDLKWLGLLWDEGPYFQSQRFDTYERHYRKLEGKGLAYPCFCTLRELAIMRKMQLRAGQPPRYTGKCARLSPEEVEEKLRQGLKPTLRFRVPKGETVAFEDLIKGKQSFQTDDIGDFIIRRSDGTPAFFFCNAVDDALMGVTHVLRGEDHLANTPRQILILRALDLPIPQYGHLPLILGGDGAPLSKRNGSQTIRELREKGYLPLAILNLLARLGCTFPEERLSSLEELKKSFSLERINRAPARYEPSQLDYWQRLAVQNAPESELWDWLPEQAKALIPEEKRALFLELVRWNCLFPEEALAWAKILFTDDHCVSKKAQQVLSEAGREFFQAALRALDGSESCEAFIAKLKQLTGQKGKKLFMPLRAALTGRTDGPELSLIYQLLDHKAKRKRLLDFAEIRHP